MKTTELQTIDQLLEVLCDLLYDELERQETALALCRAQTDGLRARDAEYLEAKTAALELLLQESDTAARSRQTLLNKVAERCGLATEWVDLSALIRTAPEPWCIRLAQFQTRMRRVLTDTRAVIRANAGLLRASMRVVEQSLGALERAASSQAGRHYTPQGAGPAAEQLQPALIDRKG